MLVLIGLAITLATEYIVVRAIDIGRTNTVFKLYLQVWLLWAVAAAVSGHRVYERLQQLRRPWRAAWRSAFVLLFAATVLYPALATPAKIRDRLHAYFPDGQAKWGDGVGRLWEPVYGNPGVVVPRAATRRGRPAHGQPGSASPEHTAARKRAQLSGPSRS